MKRKKSAQRVGLMFGQTFFFAAALAVSPWAWDENVVSGRHLAVCDPDQFRTP